MPEVNLEIPVATGGGVTEMAEANSGAEPNVMQAILTGMATDAAAATSRRTIRADQLSADSGAMWGIHMTTPTIYAGMGFRTAQQSAGYPADSGTGTGGAVKKE